MISKNEKFNFVLRSKELKDRILMTFVFLIIYRLGCFLPLPGIKNDFLISFFKNTDNSFLSMFNMFSGGSLSRMTIFALNVMPYIVSSILIQFVLALFKDDLKSFVDLDKRKINFYSKLLTVLVCIVQSSFLIFSISNFLGNENIIVNSKYIFFVVSIFTLTGSTLFLVWLGDQINDFGIGSGVSIIIFTGIISELPSSIKIAINFFDSRLLGTFIIFIIFVLLITVVIFFEKSCRNVSINYPRRQIGKKIYNSSSSFIPIKINIAGLIPAIFSSSFLMIPISLLNLSSDNKFSMIVNKYFYVGSTTYLILYFILIILLCFFYKSYVFNTKEISDSMKSSGAVIPGIRPGKYTCDYISNISFYITVIGSLYLACLCVFPEILRSIYSLPFIIGGTSILIMVSVVLDFITHIQSYLFSFKYNNMIRDSTLFGKK